MSLFAATRNNNGTFGGKGSKKKKEERNKRFGPMPDWTKPQGLFGH